MQLSEPSASGMRRFVWISVFAFALWLSLVSAGNAFAGGRPFVSWLWLRSDKEVLDRARRLRWKRRVRRVFTGPRIGLGAPIGPGQPRRKDPAGTTPEEEEHPGAVIRPPAVRLPRLRRRAVTRPVGDTRRVTRPVARPQVATPPVAKHSGWRDARRSHARRRDTARWGHPPGGHSPRWGDASGGHTPGGDTPGGESLRPVGRPSAWRRDSAAVGRPPPAAETPRAWWGNPRRETPGGETPGGETPVGKPPGGETPGGETPVGRRRWGDPGGKPPAVRRLGGRRRRRPARWRDPGGETEPRR